MNPLEAQELIDWFVHKKCAAPSPYFVKQAVLSRHGIANCVWIETGTFKGNTTRFLAERYRHVHTIEPSAELFEIAQQKCKDLTNISFYSGTSEEKLEKIVSTLEGDCCFWLDGHYSGGMTFQGDSNTPIVYELKILARHLNRLGNVAVLIDDIRCSHQWKQSYPDLNYYVNWATANGLDWMIEHDIFIAKTEGMAMY